MESGIFANGISEVSPACAQVAINAAISVALRRALRSSVNDSGVVVVNTIIFVLGV